MILHGSEGVNQMTQTNPGKIDAESLPGLPQPVKEDWEKYAVSDLIEETANLRRYVAQLFLQVKEWTTRMNDLASAAEQWIALRAGDEEKYTSLSNLIQQQDNDIAEIMLFLGMTGEENEENK